MRRLNKQTKNGTCLFLCLICYKGLKAHAIIFCFTPAGATRKNWWKQRLKWQGLSKPLSKAASATVLPSLESKCMLYFKRFSISHLPGVVWYCFSKSLLKADKLREQSFANALSGRL